MLSAAGLPPGLAADLPIRGGFFCLGLVAGGTY